MPRKKAAPKPGAARREDAAKAAPETKHPGGRPTEYRPEFAAQAEKLCRMFGAIDRDLAEHFEVTERTVNAWKEAYPEFLQSIKRGKEHSDAIVEKRLFERACGFQHPELYLAQFQGKIVEKEITKQYPPETVACIFWLKNRQPERWRDKVDLEHATKPGDPLQRMMQAIAERARLVPPGAR